jgi:predicted ATPase
MTDSTPTNGRQATAPRGPFVRRVKLRNYKSIAYCDVELGPLTVLVGRNGSGKSNFLDALAFVRDALRTPLVHAIVDRGNAPAVWRRGMDHREPLAIDFELDLGDGRLAAYALELAKAWKGYKFWVLSERLEIRHVGSGESSFFDVDCGKVAATSLDFPMPPVSSDRLYLVNASAFQEFRDVYDALQMMGFYNFATDAMRSTLVYPPNDRGELLRRGGWNILSVIDRLVTESPGVMERLNGYLATIVPGVTGVEVRKNDENESLVFRLVIGDGRPPERFLADSMSDGTLRALGALVAVAQLADGSNSVRLVGIEEPETALHPAAAGALMDALQEAAVSGQVVVTTHSADLLDELELESDRLLVVQSRDGVTEIGPIDRASRQIVKEHLLTTGELLRMDQLEVDRADLIRQRQATTSEAAEESA